MGERVGMVQQSCSAIGTRRHVAGVPFALSSRVVLRSIRAWYRLSCLLGCLTARVRRNGLLGTWCTFHHVIVFTVLLMLTVVFTGHIYETVFQLRTGLFCFFASVAFSFGAWVGLLLASGESGPLRCEKCRAYVNSFAKYVQNGEKVCKKYVLLLCVTTAGT